ncbi:MAG TPA: hypothetical protein VIK53_14395 [Verrucomicrobiae bacterium]
MRKILFIFSLCLGVLALTAGAETLTLTDGGSVTGDFVKSDDNGLMLHLSGDTYTNVPWGQFSQDALKQLSQNPKMQPFVEPFIEPDESQRPQPVEIRVNPVTRLDRPENPSLFGGLLKSSVGLFILFVLYLANLFAAYEISLFRARPVGQVMGVSAVLPLIGPIIFLAMPIKMDAPPEEQAAEGVPAGGGEPVPAEEIQITEASWNPQSEEKKLEPQIYSRGKFTFNKRFIETRFPAFMGAGQGDLAKKYTMEVRTMKDHFTAERIVQVAPTDVIFAAGKRGQVTVALADIQEIKLNPKAA